MGMVRRRLGMARPRMGLGAGRCCWRCRGCNRCWRHPGYTTSRLRGLCGLRGAGVWPWVLLGVSARPGPLRIRGWLHRAAGASLPRVCCRTTAGICWTATCLRITTRAAASYPATEVGRECAIARM
jgi:hypothetical protein